MLCLCVLMLCIIVASGTEPKCQKRLDVISYSQWPILNGFSQELTDNAVLVSVSRDGHYRPIRAVLHDGHKTYLHGLHPTYNISNDPDDTRELVEISGLSVKDIQIGFPFIAILTEDGFVWTAGQNIYGQLSGDTVDRPTFTKVQGVPKAKAMAVGWYHCILLTEDGEGRLWYQFTFQLFSWGRDRNGTLGRIPVNNNNPTPAKINLGQGTSIPTSICCGSATCMALTEDGEVFTWGYPIYIGRSGDNRVPGKVQGFPPGETVIKVTCGLVTMVALTASGRLYGWGKSQFGELLQAPSPVTSPIQLDLGEKMVTSWALGQLYHCLKAMETTLWDIGYCAQDVVGGTRIAIVRTDDEEIYYFGLYDGQANIYVTPLFGSLYPRDLMAKTLLGQGSFGAVSLGCDNNEISVTNGDAETAATTGITTSSPDSTSSATDISTSPTDIMSAATSNRTSAARLSAGAAAGLAVGIMLLVLLVVVGVLLSWLKPELMQRLRKRQEQDIEIPYSDVYSSVKKGVPSKPVPMHKLAGFLKLTKNSQMGVEAEYNEVFRHTSRQLPSNPSLTNRYQHQRGRNNISPYTFEAYGSHRKHYMLLQGNQWDRKSLWETVWQTGAENITVFGDDLKRDLFDGEDCGGGEIKTSTEYTEEFSDYIIKHINTFNKGVRRLVHVYFFLSWEKGAIPGNAAAIVDFRRKLRQRDSAAEVELVVCSGNLDRSGTFMAIDYSLHQAASENTVDVFRYCVHLLSKCTAMKITQKQYEFVHDAILEHWESSDGGAEVAQFCAGEDRDATHSGDLFQKIDTLRQLLSPNKHSYSGNAFPEKNRTPDIVPADFARPKLQTDIDEMGEYINAVYVNSYRIQHAYIATQAPLDTTFHDIWRLVYDSGASTIVMLNKVDDDGNAPRYWPFKSITSLVGNLTVRHQEEHADESGVISRLFSVTGEHDDERQVRQYQITNWSDHNDTPDSCDALLRILELTRQWTYDQGNTPIVVHCRDGAHKTGLFCAAMFIIDQLQAEQTVDIFHAVRRVQANRPQFITSQEQVAFLYKIVREFIETDPDYIYTTIDE